MTDKDLIAAKLEAITLGQGVGTEECPCSIAAINLALSGRLTDDIPDCVSRPVGRWIISIQDAMPLEMLNGTEWRKVLPLVAGTREHESLHLPIILDWMWGTVLPTIQPVADKLGFWAEWQTMTRERTKKSAAAAAYTAAAAYAVAYADAAAARAAYADAADAAAAYADAAAAAAYAVAYADAAAAYADAAAAAAYAVAYADADPDTYWQTINPPALLKRLVEARAAS